MLVAIRVPGGWSPTWTLTRFGVTDGLAVIRQESGFRASMRSTVDTAIEHEGIADPESESAKSDEGAIARKAVSLTGEERLFTLLSQRGESL